MQKIEQHVIWLFYLLVLTWLRSGNITEQTNDFFREEVEYMAWESPASKAATEVALHTCESDGSLCPKVDTVIVNFLQQTQLE